MTLKTALVIAALLALAACAATAAGTVCVSAANLNGWVGANAAGASYAFSDGTDSLLPNYGTSALHLTNNNDGGKVVVGTDAYKGINCKQITSWTMRIMWDHRNPDYGQPPSVELLLWSGQMRAYEFFPFGKTPYAAGSEPIAKDTWFTVDLLSSTGVWELANTGSTNCFGNWTWLTNRYSTQTIWSQSINGSDSIGINGCGVSIKVGPSYASSNPQPGNGGWNQKNLDGYVDWMTMTVAGDTTTYDFGALPEPGSILALAAGLIGMISLRKKF